jgi:ribosomal protein L11 methyltransferase
MKTNPLWKISIATAREAEDAVAEMLGSLSNQPATSYLNSESGKCTVSVFCGRKPANDLREKLSTSLGRIRSSGLATGSGKIFIGKIRREDWAESWKRHFKPVEIGEMLLVKPSWSKRRPRRNQSVVILDPGLSFGTGQHPTTAFCLRGIVTASTGRRFPRSQTASAPKSFLDIGTGAGILAIAAAKLGFSPVDAFDFDATSVKVARVNARRNGVTAKIRFWCGDVMKLPLRPSRRYDLICANLISTLLIAERRRIAAQLNRGGLLTLAGILRSEFASVAQGFAELGLKQVSAKTENEWRSGLFRLSK